MNKPGILKIPTIQDYTRSYAKLVPAFFALGENTLAAMTAMSSLGIELQKIPEAERMNYQNKNPVGL